VTATLDAEALERLHPRWQVWRSDESGHWWAALRGRLKRREADAGCTPFANGSSAEDLAAVLAREDELSAGASS
jgi:hypothetical protein